MMRVHDRRRRIEALERSHNAKISGIYANSNYDPQKQGQEAPRAELLRALNEEFQEQIELILNDTTREEREAEATKAIMNDPFFKGSRRFMED